MIGLLLISASALGFIFLLINFLQKYFFSTNLAQAAELPRFFTVSTIILLGTAHFSVLLPKAYREDKIKEMRVMLSLIMIGGLLFFISQSVAWLEVLSMPVTENQHRLNSYYYLFSGVHLLHVMASLTLLAVIFYRVAAVEGDPVKSIIMLTTPYEKIKLEIFTSFWHYSVICWTVIYLLLLFLV
jgi:cytochrome c oxidase subunit 3